MNDLQPLLPESTKCIAIFADIHGNRQALKAILEDITSKNVSAAVCNGDLITSSAHSDYVVSQIRQLGIPSTRGNHERYLYELENPKDEKWQLDNWATTQYEFERLEPETRKWLCNLPEMICLVGGNAPVYMTHAAPGNDRGVLSAKLSEADWQSLFEPFPQNTTLIGSHKHRFWQYQFRDYQFIRTPSAGLPLDGDTRAGYCLLKRKRDSWIAQECRVEYDLEKELSDFKRSEFYKVGGVFTHLLWLELKTAKWHVIPYFHHLAKVFPEGQGKRRGYTHEEMRKAWETFDRAEYPDYNPDA